MPTSIESTTTMRLTTRFSFTNIRRPRSSSVSTLASTNTSTNNSGRIIISNNVWNPEVSIFYYYSRKVNGKRHTVYKLLVTNSSSSSNNGDTCPQQWVLEKRFRELRALKKDLKKLFATQHKFLPFPKKKKKARCKLNDELLNKRLKKINLFLHDAFADPVIRNSSCVQQFLLDESTVEEEDEDYKKKQRQQQHNEEDEDEDGEGLDDDDDHRGKQQKREHGIATIPPLTNQKVFGVDLSEHLGATHQQVPLVLLKATEFLLSNEAALKVPGIFRVEPSYVRLKNLKSRFDAEGESAIVLSRMGYDAHNEEHVHLICGLLKAYIRELPNPLLPLELQPAIMARYVTFKGNQKKCQFALNDLFTRELPKDNIKVLRFLLDFLHLVHQNSEHNKMDARNLARVFTPSLMVPMTGAPRLPAQNEFSMVEFLITDFAYLFWGASINARR